MPLQMIETTLKDARGEDHRYKGVTLPTERGGNLLLEVADVLEGPIATALRALVGGALPDEVMDAEIGPATVGNLLGLIKLEGVFGRALQRGGMALARRMLDGMQRQTRGPGGDVWERVDDPAGFDSAYSANLPELVRALAWVARVNWLPFSSAPSGPDGTTR